MLRSWSLIALCSIGIGCARRTPGIEVTSTDFDLGPLVGQWRGTYNSTATGRSGTIAFTLQAGEAAASGNVVMIPRADSLLTAEEREMVDNVGNPARAVLRIKFVRREGGSVSGTLDPYRDPDCACQVITTFVGTFRDASTIEGTFTSVPSAPGRVTSGSWRATRVKRL